MAIDDGKILMDENEVREQVQNITREIRDLASTHEVYVIGIQGNGGTLVDCLRENHENHTAYPVSFGKMDLTLYRDDLRQNPVPETHGGNELDDIGDVTGKIIVGVDDFLNTGRNYKAFMNAITDMGRPAFLKNFVLAQSPSKDYPILADNKEPIPTIALPEGLSTKLHNTADGYILIARYNQAN